MKVLWRNVVKEKKATLGSSPIVPTPKPERPDSDAEDDTDSDDEGGVSNMMVSKPVIKRVAKWQKSKNTVQRNDPPKPFALEIKNGFCEVDEGSSVPICPIIPEFGVIETAKAPNSKNI